MPPRPAGEQSRRSRACGARPSAPQPHLTCRLGRPLGNVPPARSGPHRGRLPPSLREVSHLRCDGGSMRSFVPLSCRSEPAGGDTAVPLGIKRYFPPSRTRKGSAISQFPYGRGAGGRAGAKSRIRTVVTGGVSLLTYSLLLFTFFLLCPGPRPPARRCRARRPRGRRQPRGAGPGRAGASPTSSHPIFSSR